MKMFLLLLCMVVSSCNLIEPLFDKPKFEKAFYDCPSCNSNSTLQNDLKAFYGFQGSLGDDSSNSSLNMTWTGGGYTTQTGPHSTLALDCANSSTGNSLYVSPSSTLSMGTTTDFTLAFWAYFPALPGPSAALIDWNNSAQAHLVSFDGANKMTLTFDGATIASSATVARGSWRHYALVVDRDTGMYLYINGSLDTSNATASNIYNLASDRLQFCSRGTPGGGNSALTNGYLDDVGIWSRALTTAEVSSLASGKTPY